MLIVISYLSDKKFTTYCFKTKYQLISSIPSVSDGLLEIMPSDNANIKGYS